jgi:hypothetical protein
MRLSHLNIYYTIQNDLNNYVDIFTYDNSKLFRYTIKYNEDTECFEYAKYGLLDCVKYFEDAHKIPKSDELKLENYFEDVFGRQHIFLKFKDLLEFVIKQIREDKTDVNTDDIQDMVNLYPEKFI